MPNTSRCDNFAHRGIVRHVEPVVGLRERTRLAVRGELVAVALELFLSQGFEGTTVEQIATSAGLSRRSFHRYFASKDDVLAQALRASGDKIAAELAGRPSGETPWTALRHAFDPLVAWMTTDAQSLALTRIMLESSALQSGHTQKQESWREVVAAALAPRLTHLDESARQLEADALSGSAIACLMAALATWLGDDGQQALGRLLNLAMSAVAPLDDR
ncbi:TetR/AcrR family transcriptional regulator [Streptomyces prunicolor]|uniref:TetR/AcrR family transcriptional regulator n=1 Tax=Streptomyces prunicolor TaxID=67348 RepID=UPI00342C6650